VNVGDVQTIRLSRCLLRVRELERQCAELEASRDEWKLKADRRRNQINSRRHRLSQKRPAEMEYGPSTVAAILNIPTRDIESS